MRIAFLGTGLMGRPMVQRLSGAGHEVVVYNRTRARAEALAGESVRIAGNPAEAVQAAQCVLLMLSDEPAIRAVLLGDEVRRSVSGRTVIQMGTIGPAQSRSLMADVEAAGADYLEAPVLGSLPEARDGRLIVMVGATQQQFEAHRTLLSVFGPSPRLIGPVGQAAGIKLALNQLIASLTAAFSLSLGFVQRQGVEVDTFMGILRESALYAPTFDKKLSRMLSHDYEDPNFPAKHLAKDVDLFLAESGGLDLDTALLQGVRHSIQRALDQGLAEADYSALFEGVTAAGS
jgi:3-hydroxyisobutyrate dehydrogenase